MDKEIKLKKKKIKYILYPEQISNGVTINRDYTETIICIRIALDKPLL